MTYLNLMSNQLVVFEECVFKEMLKQMVSVQFPTGYVSLNISILSLTSSNIFHWHFQIEFRSVCLRLRHGLARSRQSPSSSGRSIWMVRHRQSVSIRPFPGLGS